MQMKLVCIGAFYPIKPLLIEQKKTKDRVTLMATANASGDFCLPLVFIHIPISLDFSLI